MGLYNLFEFSSAEFHFEIANICLTPDYLRRSIRIKIEKDNYVFTIDNFMIKILIYIRISSKVPVILLGRAGSGKTSLVKCLSYFIEDRYNLIIFNIHPGLSYLDINKFFVNNNLYEKTNSEIKNEPRKNIILFLDNINSSNCINLLKDLFTIHSYLGNKLKSNIFIIAACNPYKLKCYNSQEDNSDMNLLYNVHPLPLSLLNYVLETENIKIFEDEEYYILRALEPFLNDKFSLNNNINYKKILYLITKSVYESQKFLRNNEDISYISIREIKRFGKIFEFLLDIISNDEHFKNINLSYIKDDSIFSEAKTYKEKFEDLTILKTANLALYIFFYLRLNNSCKRKELKGKIEEILKFDFLEYPYEFEKEFVNNLNLDKKDFINRTLLDNLLTLFVCIICRIPIFISGKEEYINIISASILFKSMKGEYSFNDFFKKYPNLCINHYQISTNNNINDIKEIIESIKKLGDINDKKSILVILFKEIGLSEISINNYLKTIITEIEGQKIELVGILKGNLDPFITDRGFHLIIPEYNKEDLISSAMAISYNIYERLEKDKQYKVLIENLAKSFLNYKNYIKLNNALYKDFHGSQDFFYLIKTIAREIKNNEYKRTYENIAMESIERNFGGLKFIEIKNSLLTSSQKFKEIFIENQKCTDENINDCNILSYLKKNLENDYNRFLLLITDKTKNEVLIEYILKKLNKKYIFLQGKKNNEKQNEDNLLEKIRSIIYFIEKGELIILKDLNSIYYNLYDLFNKNFINIGDSQYVRVVLNSTTTERHIVHKNFRCIILLEQNEINGVDSSFLNCFEKHSLSFRDILTDSQNYLAQEIYQEIINLTSNFHDENKSSLININIEEIRCLLLNLSSNFEGYAKEIYKLLIPTFTQENILKFLSYKQKKYIKNEEVIKIYKENTYSNIYQFFEKVKRNKLIIYTFSSIYNDIFQENNNKLYINKIYGTISKENTVEIIFDKTIPESILKTSFKLFYEKEDNNLFIIHFRLKDSKYIKYVKYNLNNFSEKKENKLCIFIIHIDNSYQLKINTRNEGQSNLALENLEKYHPYFLPYISEFQQLTMDNLFASNQFTPK